MNEAKNPQAPGHPTLKDSVACGAVLATMVFTLACGAFVVDAAPDAHAAQVVAEASHD